MSDGRVCRLCLWCAYKRGSNATHLVDLTADGDDLLRKISACLPLKVSKEDKLPKYICNMCSYKIEDFYQFRNKALDSESRLLGGFKTDDNAKNEKCSSASIRDEANDDSVKSEIASIASNRDMEFDEFKFPEIKQESGDNFLNERSFSLQLYADSDAIKDEHSGEDVSSAKSSQLFDNSEIAKMPDVAENHKLRKKSGSKIKLVKSAASESQLSGGSKLNHSWNCCICFQKFNKRTEMLQHYRGHCITVKTDNIPVKGVHKVEQLYRCSLCEKTFRSPESILKHGKETHAFPLNVQSNEGTTVYSEPISKRFTCDICDEKFVYMKYLLLHRNAEHPETRNQRYINRCDFCHQEFTHINSLRRHLRSHSGKKEFLCNTCGKALSSQEHLKFHMRIHTGYKPNVCRVCGKGFVKKCNLVLHERVHSGERPHVCSFCGKAFSQRSTLVIHERYHSGARPYVCQLCNKGFVAQGLLSVHLKTVCNKMQIQCS